MTRHKHANLIIAWANDQSLQFERRDPNNGCDWELVQCAPGWIPDYEYRLAQTKPSINWDHVVPEYKYLARDKNGQMFLYTEEPHVNVRLECWIPTEKGEAARANAFFSCKPGTIDWRESLIERP